MGVPAPDRGVAGRADRADPPATVLGIDPGVPRGRAAAVVVVRREGEPVIERHPQGLTLTLDDDAMAVRGEADEAVIAHHPTLETLASLRCANAERARILQLGAHGHDGSDLLAPADQRGRDRSDRRAMRR